MLNVSNRSNKIPRCLSAKVQVRIQKGQVPQFHQYHCLTLINRLIREHRFMLKFECLEEYLFSLAFST